MTSLQKTHDIKDVVTAAYIRNVTGVFDEEMVKAILITGASQNEIRQACDYYFENTCIRPIRMRPMSERVQTVYNILDYSNDHIY